jgi:hypothetical protein
MLGCITIKEIYRLGVGTDDPYLVLDRIIADVSNLKHSDSHGLHALAPYRCSVKLVSPKICPHLSSDKDHSVLIP